MRPAGSIEISASSLPFSEFDVRKSRFAAWSAGKVNSPTPARVVTARSVFTPEASVDRVAAGLGHLVRVAKLLAYFASVVSAVGEESTVPTYGMIGTSPAAPGLQPAPLTWVRLKPRTRVTSYWYPFAAPVLVWSPRVLVGLHEIIPNGRTAPGQVFPSRADPISGSTYAAGSSEASAEASAGVAGNAEAGTAGSSRTTVRPAASQRMREPPVGGDGSNVRTPTWPRSDVRVLPRWRTQGRVGDAT